MNKFRILLIVFLALLILSSCDTSEDSGSLQEMEKSYSITDFDRLEIGDALSITVTQDDFFSVSVSGDRRNIEDLRVRKVGNTLVVDFDSDRDRRHETFITISMPSVVAANFSGATDSRISGFYEDEKFELTLSGASFSQVETECTTLDVLLSGASHARITGTTENLDADISGASVLSAYALKAKYAYLYATGASDVKVYAVEELHASANGASRILYQGDANVTSDISGASTIERD